MIKRLVCFCLTTLLVASLLSCQMGVVRVRVTNPVHRDRQCETISIRWSSLPSHLIKNIKSIVVRDSASGKLIVSQLFDSNLDGTADALLFQSDFKAEEHKTFFITGSSIRSPKETSLVDVKFVEPRQDIAWENDRIAHRVYGPALAAESNNGIDVWTKRVRYLIVGKWYEGEEQKPPVVYHIDHGEGADFFNVGRSLGCGGSGIWHNGRLYQPGVFSSYKIISTGPLRACFELNYDKWNIEGKKLSETKRITLDAGQNLSRIEVTYKTQEIWDSIGIASGLVKRNNTTATNNKEHGWMSLWGATNNDAQNGFLGTGVVFPASAAGLFTEDNDQYLIIGNTKPGSNFVYFAGAGWTRSGDFRSAQDWNDYLDSFALNLKSPLLVSVQ